MSTDTDEMQQVKLLLSIADSYHDFAAGDRCSLDFRKVRENLQENYCLRDIFQNKGGIIGENGEIYYYIHSPSGQPQKTVVNELSLQNVILTGDGSVPSTSSMDYESAVMAFFNKSLPGYYTHKYFKLLDDNYDDKSTDDYVYCINYAITGKTTNIASMKNIVYDFFRSDLQSDKPIGIMTDCIQNPKIIGKIFDEYNSSEYKGILNLFTAASSFDRASNKIKEARYISQIVPIENNEYTIEVSNTNQTRVSFMINPNENYTRISVLPSQNCASPSTLIEQFFSASKPLPIFNGVPVEIKLNNEVLSTTDMSVANLCQLMAKITNFDKLTKEAKSNIFKPIIKAKYTKTLENLTFQTQFWNLLQYAKSENYDPKLVLYDIKRSMDYGQIEFIRAMRLLRKSDSKMRLTETKFTDSKTFEKNIKEFSEFVIITFDRLCYMKCRVESIPCIYVKGVDTLLLTKPRAGAESIDDILQMYTQYDILTKYKQGNIIPSLSSLKSKLETYFDNIIISYINSLVENNVLNINMFYIQGNSQSTKVSKDLLTTLDWNLKRFHILYCIALCDLKRELSKRIDEIGDSLNDTSSLLNQCFKGLIGLHESSGGGILGKREKPNTNTINTEQQPLFKKYRVQNDDIENDNLDAENSQVDNKDLYSKIGKTQEFHVLEKLFKFENDIDNIVTVLNVDFAALLAPFAAQYVSKQDQVQTLKTQYRNTDSSQLKASIEKDLGSLAFNHLLPQNSNEYKNKLNGIFETSTNLQDSLRLFSVGLDMALQSEDIFDKAQMIQEIETTSSIVDNNFITLNTGKKKETRGVTWKLPKDFMQEEHIKKVTELAKVLRFSPILDINGSFNNLMQVLCGIPDMNTAGKPGILTSVLQFISDNIAKNSPFREPRSFKLNKVLSVTYMLQKEVDTIDDEHRMKQTNTIYEAIFAKSSNEEEDIEMDRQTEQDIISKKENVNLNITPDVNIGSEIENVNLNITPDVDIENEKENIDENVFLDVVNEPEDDDVYEDAEQHELLIVGNEEANTNLFKVWTNMGRTIFGKLFGTFRGGSIDDLSNTLCPSSFLDEYSEMLDIISTIPSTNLELLVQSTIKDDGTTNYKLDPIIGLVTLYKFVLVEYFKVLDNKSNIRNLYESLLEFNSKIEYLQDAGAEFSSMNAIKLHLARNPQFVQNIKLSAEKYLDEFYNVLSNSEDYLGYKNILSNYKAALRNSATLADTIYYQSEIYSFCLFLMKEGFNSSYTLLDVSDIDGIPYFHMTDYDIISRFNFVYGGDTDFNNVDDMLLAVKCIKDIDAFIRLNGSGLNDMMQEDDEDDEDEEDRQNRLIGQAMQGGGKDIKNIMTGVVNDNIEIILQCIAITGIFIFANGVLYKHMKNDPKYIISTILVNTVLLVSLLGVLNSDTEVQYYTYTLYFIAITSAISFRMSK